MKRPIDPVAGMPRQRPELTRDMRGVLAVVAHPDDESFGLGALLDRFASCGVEVSVLCFTHGEASTLRDRPGDLAGIRAAELQAAAEILGVERVELLEYPDGGLSNADVDELAGHVARLISEVGPSHLFGFDDHGVTGHADHQQATRAALSAAGSARLPMLGWTIPEQVAQRLNARHGTAFQGREPDLIDARLSVSRIRQRRAIVAHASQSYDNPVLHHRLRLLGDDEHLRVLYRPEGR